MPTELKLTLDSLKTPIGEMLIVTDSEGVLRVADWTDYEERMQRLLRIQYRHAGATLQEGRNATVRSALRNYFDGDLSAIDSLPTRTGGTDFQRKVWEALRTIPCGTTLSYGELAKQIGHPNAVRAVGLANGANPIGVVVPCHRVVGANGKLTGYGAGLHRKEWLLRHEARAGRANGPLQLRLDG